MEKETSPMTQPALSGIDHTLVGVRDLEAARKLWTRLGFTVTPRGRHIGWGTANYCIMLNRGYIELLGILDPGQFTNNLDKFLETREGLMGLAFASDDPAATKARLEALGLHPDGPKDLKRYLELPEGDALPEFRLLFLPKSETPDLSAFVCCHLTPELVRRPAWLDHANGAITLAGMTIISEQPDKSAAAYRAYFGENAVRASPGGAEVACGHEFLRFVTREGFAAIYPGQGPWPTFPAPMPAAMTVTVQEPSQTMTHLWNRAIRADRDGDRIWVGPSEANGLVLEFVKG
jgi:catechol 2,3-dioxygenase-like lactoylglutathione lyase family enzyme